LFGFAYTVTVLNNTQSNDGAGVLLGVFFIFMGALLCYAGSKIKGRNGDTTASTDKPDDDSGGKPRPWWKTDPKYDGALIDQQQRRMGWK